MPTYDPTSHPRLSKEAAALAPSVLAALADEAEAALGIAGTSYVGADREALTLAVARQVNHTVDLDQRGGGRIKSESKGDQSYTLADGDAMKTGIDPVAERIVHNVTARRRIGGWTLAGSIR